MADDAAARGASLRSSVLSRVAAGWVLGLAILPMAGCGNTYRPVVTAINPVGPSGQPTKYALAISSPGPTSPGLATLVDFSGDTVLTTTNIGVSPRYMILNSGGSTAYVINGDGTLNVFNISTSLIASQVMETTLLAGANPISIFPQGTTTYVTEAGRNAVGEFGGQPLALSQELTISNPVYVVGLQGGPRAYALSQGSGSAIGSAIGIDTATNTPTANIPVGRTPVYGIMTTDGRRAFVMNQGDGTVSVINVQTNQLDVLPAGGSSIAVGGAPVWADFAPTLSEMVVASAGAGTAKGKLAIVSIPLCNEAALTTNPNCSSTNPVDATGFGTLLANVTVGINPVMVSALQDGTRAYVANAGDPAMPCAKPNADGTPSTTPTGNCSVSVVNLTSNTVTATIPIAGRPSYIAATTGTPTGKVYVVCGADPVVTARGAVDSNARVMTVIRTDLDTVTTTIPLQGTGVSVRVTAS